MEHQEIKLLLPLAALHRLEPGEKRIVEEHLAHGCDECEEELRDFREILTALVLAETHEGVDERIWRKIENRLSEDLGGFGESGKQRLAAERVTLLRKRAAWWSSVAGMTAAAMLATVMVAAHLLQEYVHRNANTRRMVATLRHEVRVLRQDLNAADRQIVALHRELDLDTQIFLRPTAYSPDMRLIKLHPVRSTPSSSSAASGARAIIAFSSVAQSAALQTFGLPAIASDKVYELWWIVEREEPIPAALFRPGPRGDATILVNLPPPEDEFRTAAITLEAEGGSLRPTGAIYLRGEIVN